MRARVEVSSLQRAGMGEGFCADLMMKCHLWPAVYSRARKDFALGIIAKASILRTARPTELG
jgi:hypothetical protein